MNIGPGVYMVFLGLKVYPGSESVMWPSILSPFHVFKAITRAEPMES
jgi:hypothetical protein